MSFDDVSKRFNVDLAFLWGSVWSSYRESLGSYDERGRGARALLKARVDDTRQPSKVRFKKRVDMIEDTRIPNFDGARTDWNRRVVKLPTIRKKVENWSGKMEVSRVEFTLADVDGSVWGTLYTGSVEPFGTTVALYSKVSANPSYWIPVFNGQVSGYTRAAGLTSVVIEDNTRNLWNSQFIPDYKGLATYIDGNLYGTIEDIVGTNFYITDRGSQELIVRHSETGGGGWFGMAFGALVGAALGVLSGGGGLIAAGAIGGALQNLPQASKQTTQYYYKIDDYNAIPDGMVFGGQALKFHQGTWSGVASNATGRLYESVRHRVRGGTFRFGLYGTVEIDDLLEDAHIGDYVYAELPLIYFGSPDDIIRDMLTGSNVTVPFVWPDDFADDWVAQSLPLRHMEYYAYIEKFDTGGVMEAIDSLAREAGFTFYLNSENKFELKTIRELDLNSTNIIGTISEEFNSQDITVTNDVRDAYTDIEIKFKDTFANLYDKTVLHQTGAATWMGAKRRVRTINSKWIHDTLTAEYIATRMARRYATSAKTIEGQVSLYAVPIELGEIVDVTAWSVGSHKKFEIVEFAKNFGNSSAEFKAVDAEPLYADRGFGYLGTVDNLSDGAYCGFATVIAEAYDQFGSWGQCLDPISPDDEKVAAYFVAKGSLSAQSLVGSYLKFDGSDEVAYAESVGVRSTMINDITHYYVYEYNMRRGAYDTLPGRYQDVPITLSRTPIATCLQSTQGSVFRWY